MAKKQKKSKKQTKKSVVAGLVKAVAATASNVAESNKTYKNTAKKSATPSAKSLAQQGVNAAASAAASQAAAAAEAKRKQEQKRAAARNASASSMQNTKSQQKKRGGLVLSQDRTKGNGQKAGIVLEGLAGQKRDAKKEYGKFKEQHGAKAGNPKNRNKSGKKEKSGLVLAQRRTSGTLPQTGKKLYQAGKRQMNKSITDEESVTKAIKEGKSISALGTKVQKHEKTYDTGDGVTNAILKMGNIASGAAMSAGVEQTMRNSFTNPTGHHSTKENEYWESEEGQKRLDEFFASEEGKKAVADARDAIKQGVKAANKQIDKNRPAKIDYSYKDMTFADYNQLATATQQGRLNDMLKSDKELANKVANINVKDYVKGNKVMGVLDQMTQGLSVSENPAYNYSNAQKQIMEKQKETTGYKVGNMIGGVLEFGLGGTGTLGTSLAKTGGKVVLTNAAKQGGKALAKTAAKNVGKEVAADAIVSLPLNSLDALKASYKDGKFDKKTFAKELALNVSGDILIGGGVSGITHGLSARQARNFNRINKTLEKGGTVSKQEMKFYDKYLNELADEVDAAVKAQDGITKSTSASTAANATAKAKGGAAERTSTSAVTNAEVKEYARLKGKQNAGVKLTAEEQKSMNRIVAKAVNDNVEKFVNRAVEEVRAARASGEGAISNEVKKLEQEKTRQEAVIDNSKNPAEIAVAKAKLNEVNAKLDSYKAEHGEKIKKYANADAQAQRLEVGSSGTLNARTPSAEGMTSSADNISDSATSVNAKLDNYMAENTNPEKVHTQESSIKVTLDHTPEEVKRIEDFVQSVNTETLSFVKKIKNLKDTNVASKLNHIISTVSQREINDIMSETSVDVTGFRHNINGSTVNHIIKRHGKNGIADKSMAVDADIARIEYVLKNYDNVKRIDYADLDDATKSLTYVWQNSDRSASQIIKFEKKVDGTYYVVEAVPDSKAKKLQVISAYIGNKKVAPELVNMETSPHLTSKTFDPSATANNISDPTQNVNPREAETDITHKLTNEKVSAEYSNALKKLENGDPVTLEEYLSIPEIREAKNRVAAGSSSDIPDSIRGQHRHDVTEKMAAYGSAEIKIIDGKEKVEYTGSVNRDRRADIILGLPASGKSSAIVDPISQKYKSKLIDSDEAKKMLDGFDDGWGAGYVHMESVDIVNKVLANAVTKGENVVIPKVGGDYIGIEKLREMLKENGYSVNIHLCELNPNKAAGRNLRRFATTGRFVDLEATSFKYQNKPTEVYEQLVKEGNIDGHTRTSNDVGYGELPIQREGTETIPYNWRNDRRGGGDDGREGAEIHRRIQEEPSELVETINTKGAQDAPSFNAREAKLQEANNNVPFKDVAEEAYSNPGKQYDTAAEQIKADNPTPKTIRERAMKGVSEDEVATTAGKMDEIYFTADELHELYVENETKGMFDKVKGMTQAEARETAEAEIERKGVDAMAKDFIADELPADGHLTAAKVEVLMRELKKSYDNGVDNKVLQMQVVEKAAVEFSSESGRNLNAVKMFLKMTPYGRVRTAMKQADALNAEFASRLKGKKVELSDEQIDRIFKAETDEEIAAVMEKVNLEIWDKIPSSFMEKINTVRHIKMLFNVKTNGRNLGGNMAFRGVRSISDAIEYQLTSKVFKRALQNKNIDSVMGTNVTHSEISNAKGYIYNDVFPENYKNSNSTNKYVEKRRPDGSTVLKSWAGAGLEKATYKVLELGDIYPAFRPAYAKSYLRWCKHQGIDISNIDALRNMTKKQKAVANQYALKVAEEATFRDTCLVSDKLVALKTKTESGQGKTSFGTAGLRMANVVLESLIPYVKTPINVFRRSVDYSPFALIKVIDDFATYAARKDADALLKGIHHLSTCLTGSGVTLLGMWLASQDFVMVKAGEVSGDAYYDRDMGYQDYSLIIGGKSITIDWASPMQTSFFLGAQAFNIFQQRDDLDGMDFFNTALTLFEPHLDSSFMSSAKDTLELFVETATGDGTDSSMNWGEAILVTLGGTIPQNYINTFLTSQLTNQAAQAFDKYQRDTRSTSDNPLEKSWEAWGRRVINRVPGFRNMFLNEKINRKGENVKTEGENVVTRLFHAFMNPSNVKTINMTKTDKEIIDIYKNMPATTKQEKEEKRWFFYNLTGQSFDKGDGTRMTYAEAHVHGQKLRGSQWKAIETMTNSKRYKNMDNSMKVKEIGAYNKISTTKADRKVYGSKFATDRVVNQYGSDADKRVANKYRDIEGKSDADFLNFYVRKETMLARAHDTDDYTKAAACYQYGDWQTAKMYGISRTQWNAAKDYFDNKGGSVTKYINGTCNAISTLTKAGADISRRNKAVASADYGTDIATLNAMGIRNVQANMGYGLNKEFGYSYDALRQHVSNAEYSYDLDDSGSLSKSEVKAYVDSLGLKTSAEKACLFEYIYNRETKSNPYGSIPNYLGISNASSSGKSSRKGYRRSSGKGSKASKETAEKPAKSNLPSWEDYVKDYITEVEGTSGVKFKDWDSPLDQAYRNKINSILKKMDA